MLVIISADTTQDEEAKKLYIVRVRTEKHNFGQNEELPIIPGMTASVDIITGKRTVLEYMLNQYLALRTITKR